VGTRPRIKSLNVVVRRRCHQCWIWFAISAIPRRFRPAGGLGKMVRGKQGLVSRQGPAANRSAAIRFPQGEFMSSCLTVGPGHHVRICGGSNSGLTSAPRWPQALQVNFGLRVRQAHRIRPACRVNHDRVRTLVVAAINQEPGRTVVSSRMLRCHSACNIDPPYCRICECYPDGAIADDDPMSIDRPRQVAFPACSTRGAVGGSGPT
jgi:hypothetical protein